MNLLHKIFYFGVDDKHLQTENRKIFILNIWNFTAIVVQIPYMIVATVLTSFYDALLNINFVIVAGICYILSYRKKYSTAYTLIIMMYPILLASIMWRFGEGKNILMLFVVIGLAVPFFFDNVKNIVLGSLYVMVWAFIASYIEFPDFLLKQNALASQLFAILNLSISIVLGAVFVTVLNQENLRFEQNIIRQNQQLKVQKNEIEMQKNDLLELHEELSQQNLALQESNEIIQNKNQTIADSIQYAQRIQKSILPLEENIKKYLPSYFIFFQPRDVVSGDFYYFEEKNGKAILAAIDCTGHGIPGALMTMLGAETMNEIILNKGIVAPDLILNELHKNIRKTLKQAETDNRDGMDLALITIDRQARKVEYAGAKNPLIYIQNNELHLIKADKMPIGGEQREQERLFTKHEIEINSPTMFYLFSDGFQDQFGGEQNKKFTIMRLKELFLQIHTLPLPTQQQRLNEAFETWREQAGEKQIDDVLVVGISLGE
jgi:serine phosphatase RsbU (regulator of sigma subunit)